jgi:hypothetical protein
VKIMARRGGWITVSPLQARPDPENIEALKAEVSATWPMTSLLDIIKEADLRLDFTDALSSRLLTGRSTALPCGHACCCACMGLAPTLA